MAATTFDGTSSELLATYTNLGFSHGNNEYTRGEECLACVKDLIRALRTDDSQCEIRRQLGRAGILKKDLFHILVDSSDDPVLRNDVLRLLVNLTQPAYLCFGNTYPKNKERGLMRAFMEVNYHLRSYKTAFTSDTVMDVLGSMLADLSQKEWADREDEDIIVIERILLLIRNILHISPDPSEERRTEDDVNLHDQIIWKLHDSGMNELFLFLSSSSTENQWCIHVLEILFLLFKEQSASILARTGREKSREERERTEIMLDEVLAQARKAKKKSLELRGARHSRFGGTFVVHNHKSISGKERIFHKPVSRINETSYDSEKRPRRVNKLRRPIHDLPKDRTSTYSIRLVLKNLCVQFLHSSYNHLMKTVKESIMRRRAMENDETYYLWSLQFFMEFSRVYDFRADLVGETLQLPTLHYVITLCANYYESMVVEKRSTINARQWAQRLHYALKAYKEILLHIQEMGKSPDETLRESAKVIVSNILYHPEYREVLVTLLRNFQEVFQTRAALRDLVETAHVYIHMLEVHCQQNTHVMTKERKKKSGGKRKKGRQGLSGPKALNEDQLIDLWETIDARVEELMEGVEPLPRSHSPFNPASQVSVEEQKMGAMGMIRLLLIEASHPEAVSLLRAAREVWPGEEFGSPGLSVDEEMEVMQAILYNTTAVLPLGHLMGGANDDDDEEGVEEGEGGGAMESVETQFNIRSYLEKFANNKIVRVYTLLLDDYKTNSDFTNNAVIKLLYYISCDLKMAPLLFHISIFTTLSAILQEPRLPRFKNLQKCACHIVRSFFAMAQTNSLMFVELLVWKTSRDCYELEEGYGTIQRQKDRLTAAATWTKDQEEELATLYKTYAGEEDIVGCIEAALEGSEVRRSRKQILNQIVAQGLVSDRKALHKKAAKKKVGGWDEDEVSRLREVYGEVRELLSGEGEKELVQQVADHFPHRGVREVARQMREEGWLQGKSKKRTGKRDKETEEPKKFLSASYVNTSEDESSDEDSRAKQRSKIANKEEGTKKFQSASYVDTSEDSSSDDDIGQLSSRKRNDVTASAPRRESRKLSSSMVDMSDDEDATPTSHHGNQVSTPLDISSRGSGGVISQDESASLSQVVSQLCVGGHEEVLQWLEAYLLDEARDRTVDGEWEEMSIVAPSNSNIARSLQSAEFRGLLRSLGLQPPVEHEPFWRIPSSMPPEALRRSANALKITDSQPLNSSHMTLSNDHMTHSNDHMTHTNGHMTHSNGLANSEEHNTSHDLEYDELFEEERTKKDALKLLRKMKRKSPLRTPTKTPPASVKKPRLGFRSEFLESDDSESEFGIVTEQPSQSSVGKKNKRFLEDSDEEEGERSSSSPDSSVMDESSLMEDSRKDEQEGSDSELSEEEGKLAIVE